jgi:hypothetical protein
MKAGVQSEAILWQIEDTVSRFLMPTWSHFFISMLPLAGDGTLVETKSDNSL